MKKRLVYLAVTALVLGGYFSLLYFYKNKPEGFLRDVFQDDYSESNNYNEDFIINDEEKKVDLLKSSGKLLGIGETQIVLEGDDEKKDFIISASTPVFGPKSEKRGLWELRKGMDIIIEYADKSDVAASIIINEK